MAATSRSAPQAATDAATVEQFVPFGHWTIDPEHSSVNFVVNHLGITRLHGRFADLAGSVASKDGVVSGTATVSANSVQTGSDARDKHLKGPDFLNADVNPHIVFTLERVQANEHDFLVEGTITINGITRPMELVALSGGTAKDPYGHDRVGLMLTSRITRKDFDITFDPMGALIGDQVTLEIDLSLVRQPEYLLDAERRHAATQH
ncbi:MAG: YceI family protein [Gaiellales bacterium]